MSRHPDVQLPDEVAAYIEAHPDEVIQLLRGHDRPWRVALPADAAGLRARWQSRINRSRPEIVLDESAVQAFADNDPRVSELMAMAKELSFDLYITVATFATRLDKAQASELENFSTLYNRVMISDTSTSTLNRARELSQLHGVSLAQSTAAAFAIDNLMYLATWRPGPARAMLGPGGEQLIIDLTEAS